MAQRAKRNTALRHLTRELVRENFTVTEVMQSYADSLDEEAKRVEQNPAAREEVHLLERQALELHRIAHDSRQEFG